jgi:CelD/BcsL family acetyltransferase involved in cellulose biosynthesis
MHVERIGNLEELESLAPAWDRLAQGVPFRKRQWLVSWWRHYGPPAGEPAPRGELFVLAVRDEAGTPVALAPWHVDHHAARGNVVRFLGSGEVCTDHLTVLCQPGQEQEVADVLAEWLVGLRAASKQSTARAIAWDMLEFLGISADDALMARLVEQLAQRGALVDRRPAERCWQIQLPADWNDYLQTLSKSHRKQLRRLERRWFDSGRAALRTPATVAELEHAFDLLVDLHQRRRSSLGQRGCFESPPFAGFLRATARQFFELGQLGLCWLELDSRPVACEFQLLGEGKIYAYQAGIEPAALDDEPGRLATLAILRAAVENGQHTYDLLRGDEAYKAHWRAEPRPCVDLRVWSGEGANWLRHGVWRARENLKYWAKGAWQRTGAKRPQSKSAPNAPRQ